MLIGPYPGKHEDATGLPFTTADESPLWTRSPTSGDELDRFLDGVILPDRHAFYLTNLYKTYNGYDYEYTAEDLAIAEPELRAEVAKVQPSLIVAMGREVTRLLLGDVDVTDVESIPWLLPDAGKWGLSDNTVVYPMLHLAAGMRNADLSPYISNGFAQLGEYLNGNLEPRKLFDDPYMEPVYEQITSDFQFDASLAPFKTAIHVLGLDSEGHPDAPWSVQYSFEPGRGYLIRQATPRLLGRFRDFLHRVRPRIAVHSALHDFAVGRALDLPLHDLTFDDTMVMAYLLQLVPQGLKAGCLRYCNMAMSSYDDVMGDVQNEIARNYLTWLFDGEQHAYEDACETEFTRLTTTPYTDAKGRVKLGRKLRSLPKLPKSPLHRAVTRILGSERPYGLWLDQIEDVQVAGYAALGAMPRATLDDVEPVVAIPYGCRDADGTGRLLPEYRRRIDALGLREVYDLELSTYPLIDRMQQIGVKPDLEHFAELSAVLGVEIEVLHDQLVADTGNPAFNANSGDQVAAYLFDELGLDSLKDTKGGRGSTNDKILEALEHENPHLPVLTTIRAYRETYKLKHTFVDRLPDFANRYPYDGRVHATFRTTRVVTGRLAASDPNLLAQPEHGKFAKDFQTGWIADEGHVVLGHDQSQLELRTLAHLSEDPLMLAVFRGEKRNPDGSLIDLHAVLAERIFGVPPHKQDKHKHRYPAKTVHFLIGMGGTYRGLQVQLRANGVEVDDDTSQRWLDETMQLYTGFAAFRQASIQEAIDHGFVREPVSGRIRYIGGILSRDDRVREEAERFTYSFKIQALAQTVMKQAEARVWNEVLPYFWKRGVWCEPILQVHDCLRMEVGEGSEQELHLHMTDAMTHVPKGLLVPLAVDGEFGRSFAETEKF